MLSLRRSTGGGGFVFVEVDDFVIDLFQICLELLQFVFVVVPFGGEDLQDGTFVDLLDYGVFEFRRNLLHQTYGNREIVDNQFGSVERILTVNVISFIRPTGATNKFSSLASKLTFSLPCLAV